MEKKATEFLRPKMSREGGYREAGGSWKHMAMDSTPVRLLDRQERQHYTAAA